MVTDEYRPSTRGEGRWQWRGCSTGRVRARESASAGGRWLQRWKARHNPRAVIPEPTQGSMCSAAQGAVALVARGSRDERLELRAERRVWRAGPSVPSVACTTTPRPCLPV